MEKRASSSAQKAQQRCTNPECKRIRDKLQEEIRRQGHFILVEKCALYVTGAGQKDKAYEEHHETGHGQKTDD